MSLKRLNTELQYVQNTVDVLEEKYKSMGYAPRDLVLLREGRDSIQNAIDNFEENPIVCGCNYHTTWQSKKAMRFVLVSIDQDRAKLKTRTTGKRFYTDLKDLIFIHSSHNTKKMKSKLADEAND